MDNSSNMTPAFDFFKLLFTDEILNNIIAATNQCAEQILNETTAPHHMQEFVGGNLSTENLLIFLSILFHMVHIK